MRYKTYIAQATFSARTCCFHGEVINLKKNHTCQDAIVFLASTKHALPEALQQAVEQYLQAAKLEISYSLAR